MTSTENLAASLDVRVGSIFTSSWGYDQTNVDWYTVTKVSPSGKTVTLMQISAHTVADRGSQVEVAPDPTTACGECGNCSQYIYPDESNLDGASYIHRHRNADGDDIQGAPCYNGKGVATPRLYVKRLSAGYGGGASVSMTSYATASLWTGGTATRTGFGWGH